MDTLGVPARRVHEKAVCPQRLPRHVDGALALDVGHHAGHRQLGRDAQQHVDVVGQDVPLLYSALLLLGQPSKDDAEFSSHDTKERSSPVFGDENNVVFAVPFSMRKTFVVLRGFFVWL